MSMLEHALDYLARGWSIFPIEAGGKEPLIPSWQPLQKRLPTKEQVEAWWTRWPDAGIAIVTGKVSGMVVVDVDPQHGGSAEGLPAARMVAKTGGGGSHHYYDYPAGVSRVPNQVNVDGTGMDVRADGGYVIAPPSQHHSGAKYIWWSEQSTNYESAPDWAIQPAPKPEDREPSTEKWLTELIELGSPVGQRNKSLVRLAGYYASKALPMDAGLALCHQWNTRLDSPMPRSEVDVTVRSAYKMERRKDKKSKEREDEDYELNVLPLDEYMLKHGWGETAWTVQDWLPKSTIAFLLSPPQTFKTWVLFDLACAVASGQPFLGKFPVHDPGPVILFQQEDALMSIAQRTAIIGTERLGMSWPSLEEGVLTVPNISNEALPLYYHEERKLRFDDPKSMDALERVIQKIKPKLIMVDPMYSAADTDEYMAKAAQHMLRLKTFRDTYGCGFVIVHHTRKAMDSWDRQQLWGSQFVNAYIETSWLMRKPDVAENREAVVLRHTKDGGPMPFAHLTFDIETKKSPGHYRVTTETVDEEQANNIIANKKTTEIRPNVNEERVLAFLAQEGALTEGQLAALVNVSLDKIRKAVMGLLHKHRVKQDATGRWSLLDRAFK